MPTPNLPSQPHERRTHFVPQWVRVGEDLVGPKADPEAELPPDLIEVIRASESAFPTLDLVAENGNIEQQE